MNLRMVCGIFNDCDRYVGCLLVVRVYVYCVKILSWHLGLLCLLCFITSWTCVVISAIVVVCCLCVCLFVYMYFVFDCVGELFLECACYL